ncbi:MAG: prepilin peptidase [Anaerolineae bacterium]|nr:prepilin peptidase [Anaerolineae bacterium]
MIIILALIGLLVGGVVNRLADQLPQRRSLLKAGACASCGRPYDWGGFFAVAAFPLRRGRCPACAAPLPLRPILVEIALILLFPFLWQQNGWTLLFVAESLYASIFVLISAVDFEHRRILNVVIYPSTALALLASLLRIGHDTRLAGVVGGFVGFVFFFFVFLLGELLMRMLRRSSGGPALGAGDVKLAAFIGLVAGWPGVIPALILGILLGGLGALVVLVVQVTRRTYKPLTSALPYGPFLAAGGLAMVLWGEKIVRWWLRT